MDVSVAMATRNRLPQMQHALPSILAQRPAEVIIVNDGSTDGLEAYLDGVDWGATELVYRRRPPHPYTRNPGDAFNLAASLATHPTLVMTCADVLALGADTFARMLALQVAHRIVFARTLNVQPAFAAELPGIGTTERAAVLSRFNGPDWRMTEDGVTLGRTVPGRGAYDVYCGRERPAPWLFLGMMPTALWREIGGYNETLVKWADVDLARRALAAGVELYGCGGAVALHINHARR